MPDYTHGTAKIQSIPQIPLRGSRPGFRVKSRSGPDYLDFPGKDD